MQTQSGIYPSIISDAAPPVTLSVASMNTVKNKMEKAEHLKLQIMCIIIKWVTGHCAWASQGTASRLAVHSVRWEYTIERKF